MTSADGAEPLRGLRRTAEGPTVMPVVPCDEGILSLGRRNNFLFTFSPFPLVARPYRYELRPLCPLVARLCLGTINSRGSAS
jgi:hypothetical protein